MEQLGRMNQLTKSQSAGNDMNRMHEKTKHMNPSFSSMKMKRTGLKRSRSCVDLQQSERRAKVICPEKTDACLVDASLCQDDILLPNNKKQCCSSRIDEMDFASKCTIAKQGVIQEEALTTCPENSNDNEMDTNISSCRKLQATVVEPQHCADDIIHLKMATLLQQAHCVCKSN